MSNKRIIYVDDMINNPDDYPEHKVKQSIRNGWISIKVSSNKTLCDDTHYDFFCRCSNCIYKREHHSIMRNKLYNKPTLMK
jgi:hypothetical protein